MVYDCKENGNCADERIREVAKGVKKKVVREFAETKHKGLPEVFKKKKKKKRKKKKKSKSDYMIENKLVRLLKMLEDSGLKKESIMVESLLKNAFLIGPHTPFVVEVTAPVLVEVAAPAAGVALTKVAAWIGIGSLVLLPGHGGSSSPKTLSEMDDEFINTIIKHISKNLDDSISQIKPISGMYSTLYETSGGSDIDMDRSDIDPNWDSDMHDPNDTDTDTDTDTDVATSSQYEDNYDYDLDLGGSWYSDDSRYSPTEMSQEEALDYLEALKEFYEDNKQEIDLLVIEAYNFRETRDEPGTGEVIELRPGTNLDSNRETEQDEEQTREEDKTNSFSVFAERNRDGDFEGYTYHFFKGGAQMAEYINTAIESSIQAQRVANAVYGEGASVNYDQRLLDESDPYRPIAVLKSMSIGSIVSSIPPIAFSELGVAKNSAEICRILSLHLPIDERTYKIFNVSATKTYHSIVSVISLEDGFATTMLVYRSAAMQSTNSIGTGVC